MADLIACISTGKGTWGHVQKIIEAQPWRKIFLITNKYASENFRFPENAEQITIDPVKPIPEIEADIKKQLEDKIMDTQVAVNFVSGEGKEHMALLSALLKLGLGIRLMALTKDGVKEL
jgi:hypothetical protein